MTRIAPHLLFALAFVAFALGFPERLYGDDVWFVCCIVQDMPFTPHFLFMPVARGASWAGAQLGIDPFLTLRLLSALGSAAGGAFLLAAGLRRGLATWAALALALLPLAAPSTVFFSTAAEIHGLHLGAVGFLIWTVARMSPGCSVASIFLSGIAFGVVVGTHKSGGLLLPGWLAAYALATGGREPRTRIRDGLAIGAAGLVALITMLSLTRSASGEAVARDDSPLFYLRGLLGRLEHGYGVGDFANILSIDWVAPSALLAIAGAWALGATIRRRRRLCVMFALLLVPYGVFFPLWNYPENGAYFIVTLPLLAAVLLFWLLDTGGDEATERTSLVGFVPLAVGVLGACLRPDEIVAALGTLAPACVGAGALALGALFPKPPPVATRGPLLVAVLVLASLLGAVRNLVHYDREQPLLTWTRGALEEANGEPTMIVVLGFQELWMLRLLGAPWPEPYAETWDFGASLPLPGPRTSPYGDPNLPVEQFFAAVAESLGTGERVYLDERIAPFVLENPAQAPILTRMEATYELVPVERHGFRGLRVEPRR